MSIALAMAFAEWNKTKINFLDTPGFNMFVHEAKMAMPAAEAAIVVVDGVAGVEVVTEKVWQYAEEYELPRIVVASRMDRDRADYDRVLESVTGAFGRSVVPVQLPIGSEKNLSGVVDVVRMKAYTYELGGNGKGKEGEIPANLKDAAQAAHEKLVEMVAEGNDALMEKFSTGHAAEEELHRACARPCGSAAIVPMLFASGLGNIAADRLMDFIVDYLPSAVDAAGEGSRCRRRRPTGGTQGERQRAAFAFVFKTVSDPSPGASLTSRCIPAC